MQALPHWSASIHKNYEGAYSEPMCMAAIIDAQWVLTSYSCLDSRPATYTRVALARENLGTLDRLDDLLLVKAIYYHPHAGSGKAVSDLALLQLEQPLVDDDWPSLPRSEAAVQSATEATTYIYSKPGNDLTRVDAQLLSAGYCHNQLGIEHGACLASYSYPLAERDTGAALVTHYEGQTSLVAMLSAPEDESGYPVISDISQSTHWIKQVMAGDRQPSDTGVSGSVSVIFPIVFMIMTMMRKR